MRVLVTGGAGFIGSNFIHHVMQSHPGIRILNLDLLTYAGHPAALETLDGRKNYEFVQGDVADAGLVDRLMSSGFDAVVNFAAESHVDRSISGPDPFVRTNIVGTHCLLESARKTGVQRFVQISSDEVYGPVAAGRRVAPGDPLDPSNAYAASKAGADLLVAAAVRTHGFPGIITRCTNNYGPWQHVEKLIPLLVTRALGGGVLPIYGDGRQVRDWIHVSDHCRALTAILMSGVAGRIYTIAGGCALRNRDVARRVLQLAGTGGARIQHVEDRPGHDRRYALDDDATRNEFDWRPEVSFDRGLRQTVEWYRAHRAWWEPITETQSEAQPDVRSA